MMDRIQAGSVAMCEGVGGCFFGVFESVGVLYRWTVFKC